MKSVIFFLALIGGLYGKEREWKWEGYHAFNLQYHHKTQSSLDTLSSAKIEANLMELYTHSPLINSRYYLGTGLYYRTIGVNLAPFSIDVSKDLAARLEGEEHLFQSITLFDKDRVEIFNDDIAHSPYITLSIRWVV